MRLSSTIGWSLASVILVGAALTACDVTTADPPPVYRDKPGGGTVTTGETCPAEYKPVCAERGTSRQTFENECEARKAGWEPAANGTCEKPHS